MHKFFHINKYFCLGFITAALLGGQFVRANDETFQNNLLKMDVYKTSLGTVKVTLYTNKPYKDAVVVNKKSDNEYVILMPETASTLTSKPALKSTSDVLTKVDVKTQQINGQKGYTKITISTLKPVEITPQVQTLNVSGFQLSEKETKELMEQAGKKHVSTPSKQAAKTVYKKTAQQKSVQKPVEKASPKTAQKATKQTNKQVVQKTALKLVTKAVQKEAALTQKTQPKASAKPQPTTATTEQVAQTKVQEVQTKPEEKQALQPQSETQPTAAPVKTPVPENIVTYHAPVQETAWVKILNKINDKYGANQYYANILIAMIPLLIGLLILTVDKRNKTQNAANPFKKGFTTPTFGEKTDSSAADYISEEMDWKEKFQAYKSQHQHTKPTPIEEFSAQEVEEPSQYGYEDEEEESLDLENLFAGKDFKVTLEEEVEGEEAEETAAGYGLNAQETPQETPQGWPQPQQEQYQPYQAAPTEAQESTLDDTIWSDLMEPETAKEVSIEDLFGEDETEEALPPILPQRSLSTGFTQPTFNQPELTQEELAPAAQTSALEFDFETAFNEFEQKQAQTQTATAEYSFGEEENELGISSKSAFQIDATKGFHLIDFEDTTALVGYINEDIFVLKRFEKPAKGRLQARMSEHMGNSANYMVKVDDFKALVEVTPEKMNLLLEM